MPSTSPKVAVLDDEPKMRQALRRLLKTHDFLVQDYESANELFDALPQNPADCLVLDLHMPVAGGLDVLWILTTKNIPLPVVVITGHDEPGTEERARAFGASAYLTKPVDESALVRAITAAIAIQPS